MSLWKGFLWVGKQMFGQLTCSMVRFAVKWWHNLLTSKWHSTASNKKKLGWKNQTSSEHKSFTEDYSSYLLFESKELRSKVAVFFQWWEMHPLMSPWKKENAAPKHSHSAWWQKHYSLASVFAGKLLLREEFKYRRKYFQQLSGFTEYFSDSVMFMAQIFVC